MVDISAIGGVLASLQAAKDIAQTMIGLRDAAAFQGKMIEFQSKILDAQSSAFAANEERTALIQRVRELEQKMADLEAWHAEKQRYELTQVALGAVAYVVKQDARGAEPVHWICANCYQRGKKSYLQTHRDERPFAYWRCHECSGEIRVPAECRPQPPIQYPPIGVR